MFYWRSGGGRSPGDCRSLWDRSGAARARGGLRHL